MTKFQVGNIIKVKHACSGAVPNKTYIIGTYDNSKLVALDENQPTCSCQHNWTLSKIDIIKLNKECVEYDKSPLKVLEKLHEKFTREEIEEEIEDASETTIVDIASVDDLRI